MFSFSALVPADKMSAAAAPPTGPDLDGAAEVALVEVAYADGAERAVVVATEVALVAH